MPVSQGSAGGIPGLNLKAWAYVKADGTLIRGFNVSGSSKTAVGSYNITFAAAMASTDYVARATTAQAGAAPVDCTLMSSTTGVASVRTRAATVNTDIGALWEFYE